MDAAKRQKIMIPNSELFGRIDELQTLITSQPIPQENKMLLCEWLEGLRDRIKQDESEKQVG